jgi:TET-associated glycosyltransferase-like protein
MKLLIPTYRRPNSQATFHALPSEWLKDVVMVTDSQDSIELRKQPEFYGIDFWIRPPHIMGIAQKRKWMFENILEDKIAMLDDDLSFEVRTGITAETRREGEELTRVANQEDVGRYLTELDTKLDTYAHAGFSVRRHNNNLPSGWFEVSRAQCVLGFRPKTVREHCILGRIETREDFDYTLQLLKKGYPNTICSEILFSQKINSPGGVSTYRTVESSNAEALQLEALHPGIVKAVQRQYKTQQKDNFGTRTEVICYWKKAYEQGVKEYGRQEV